MIDTSNESTIVVPPLRPRRWVTLVLCTLIFLAGGVLGSVLTVWMNLEEWPRPRHTFEERRDHLVDRIAGKLRLHDEQTDALREIVGERLRNLETIREKILPEMQIEAETLNRELTPILNEQQKQQWTKLYATLYERWFPKPTDQEKDTSGNGETPPPIQKDGE